MDPEFAASKEYADWKQGRENLKATLFEKCSHLSKEVRQVTTKDLEDVTSIVKNILKDPFSAQFRNITKSSEYDECFYNIRYSGEVNAKNEYGGYAGYKRFDVDTRGYYDTNIKYDVDTDQTGFMKAHLEFLQNRNERMREEMFKRSEERKKSWVCVIAIC